jgi:hypothetical protein
MTRIHRRRVSVFATSDARAKYRGATHGPTLVARPAMNADAANAIIDYWLATAVNPVPDAY